MTALEQMTVADLTREHVGVELLIVHDGKTYTGGLSDVEHGHLLTLGGGLPPMTSCAYLVHLGGRNLMLPGDALVLAVAPADPCDGTSMPQEIPDEPRVQPADAPSATTVDPTDERRAVPRGARRPSAMGARATRPAVTSTPSERPRTPVWRRAHLAARQALRAAGPALVIVVAVACITAGLLEAVTAPRISGDTITAGVAVMTGGGLLMRLLWISERRAGLR